MTSSYIPIEVVLALEAKALAPNATPQQKHEVIAEIDSYGDAVLSMQIRQTLGEAGANEKDIAARDARARQMRAMRDGQWRGR